jgi:serine/threonine-protein kinase HipA
MTLVVRYGVRTVGLVRAADTGRLSFTYDAQWLEDESAFPISLSLPLRDEPYGDAGHAFFANLLPEAGARDAVCRKLGISEDNDYALLRAIGGECAGALSVGPEDAPPPDADAHSYEALSDARIRRLASVDAVPLLAGGPSVRLSLAGAQDKLPVALMDGRLHLPLAGAPSTHILKLPNPRYAHLTANEAFVLGLAGRIGHDVVKGDLLP